MTHTQKQLCAATSIPSFVQCSDFILATVFANYHIYHNQSFVHVITWNISILEWIDTYGIHHWWLFRSSYRKLTQVKSKPKTAEFCSDAWTNQAMTWSVQLACRANLPQLLQFHPLFSAQISFQPLPSLVATFNTNSHTVYDDISVAEWIDPYNIHQ